MRHREARDAVIMKAGRAAGPPRDPDNRTLEIALDLSGGQFGCWVELFAAMTWPNDLDRRRSFRATHAALAIDRAERTAVPGDDGTVAEQIRTGVLNPAGGLGTLASSDGSAEQKAASEALNGAGQVAGAVLCVAAQMWLFPDDGGFSLNRAWTILHADRGASYFPAPTTMSGFKENVWARWRSVAPLHAAYLIVVNLRAAENPNRLPKVERWSIEELTEVLAYAEWFRVWATTTRPMRSHGPLIPHSEAIRILPSVAPHEPPLSPLRKSRSRISRAYKTNL